MCLNNSLKVEVFRRMIEEVSRCRKCSLWKARKKPVVGDGDVNSTIVFIGEAPGYREDVMGKPFVGAAGKLLDELLRDSGLLREKVYITNVVKCRPPGNRDPRPEEIEACKDYLDRELDLIKPKIIVTLGRHSTAYIFSKAHMKPKPISEVQGKVFEVEFWGEKTYIIPSYHPAAALYNAKLKGEIEKAIKIAGSLASKVIGEGA